MDLAVKYGMDLLYLFTYRGSQGKHNRTGKNSLKWDLSP